MQDRPTALELLDVVREFLDREVVPALDGRLRFHARVAANVLAIVGRELAGEEDALRAEWTRLAALEGRPGAPMPEGAAAARAAIHAATAALAERIRRGELDGARAVRAHVRATVQEKLAAANPRYLAGAPSDRTE
ncbi:MAG TPA: DUF6285 domain-containing protein [Candidatus Binatia bacterium]|jgi:hypothetical protein|nr:DUF6285 domain-containing protein [Candidatus Binatia bacterium]